MTISSRLSACINNPTALIALTQSSLDLGYSIRYIHFDAVILADFLRTVLIFPVPVDMK